MTPIFYIANKTVFIKWRAHHSNAVVMKPVIYQYCVAFWQKNKLFWHKMAFRVKAKSWLARDVRFQCCSESWKMEEEELQRKRRDPPKKIMTRRDLQKKNKKSPKIICTLLFYLRLGVNFINSVGTGTNVPVHKVGHKRCCSILSSVLCQTLLGQRTRSCAQLLYCMLHTMCQDQCKPTGTKAACRMKMKLTLGVSIYQK